MSCSKQLKGVMSDIEPMYGWSDDVLDQLVQDITVPKIQEDNEIVKNVLLRFWYYYVTGNRPEGVNTESIIYSAILCAVRPTYSEDKIVYVFPEEIYNHEGKEEFFKLGDLPTSDSKLVWEYKTKILNQKDVNEKSQKSFTQFEDENNSDFVDFLKKVFGEWDSNKELTSDSIYLLKLTSVISIMCMKALVQNNFVLEKTFLHKKLYDKIIDIMHISRYHFFGPPCKVFLYEIKCCIDQNNAHSRMIFTIILHRYIYETRYQLSKHAYLNDNHLIALLNFACLTHMSYHNLCVIKLLNEVCDFYKSQFHSICFEYYLMDKTDIAWQNIIRFLNECQRKDKFSLSAKWCRLVNKNYYAHLDDEKVSHIIVWLGSILSVSTSKGIFSSVYYKKFLSQHPLERNYGICLNKLFNSIYFLTPTETTIQILNGILQKSTISMDIKDLLKLIEISNNELKFKITNIINQSSVEELLLMRERINHETIKFLSMEEFVFKELK